jgi:hypothetical protein
MAKRARISDNDPLSPTDDVLASFGKVNKSTSQQADNPTTQEIQHTEPQQLNKSVTKQASKPASRQADKSTSRATRTSASQQVEKSASQQADKSGTEVDNASASQEVDKLGSQQVEKLKSQEVGKLAIRKSTFQLSEDILQQLETFHLQLQLELGRGNAPYKEVIVEEAIAQFLEQDRDNLLAGLQQRQQRRA